jgi:DNA-binding transcriptional MerR regulator
MQQMTLLQDDLFSSAGESLPAGATATRKPRPTKISKPEPEQASGATALEPTVHASDAEQADDKAPGAFKTISEVADFLDLPQHVLRFWESRFSQIKPLKLRGGRRYYRPDDIEVLSTIKHLLYKQGYTINGAKKAFSQGKNALIEAMHAEKTQTISLPKTAPKISDKQKQQLASIRTELYALRETLRPYTQANA